MPDFTIARPGKQLIFLAAPFVLVHSLLIFWAQDHAFFWDTLSQASRRAHWYYETHFSFFFLSPDLDSGHPVFFNMYLAAVWTAFGKSLVVSHWAMAPFIFLLIWQLSVLVSLFITGYLKRVAAMVLLICVPAWLGHSILVSPDIVLLSGFLFGFVAILKKQPISLFIAFLLISSVSIRGVFLIAVLGGIQIGLTLWESEKPSGWAGLDSAFPRWPYLMITLLLAAYFYAHFRATGWWIVTPQESWAHHREMSGPFTLVRNIGLVGWRMLDFGMFAYWLVLGVLVWSRGGRLFKDPNLILLYGSAGLTLIGLALPMILIQNPITNRYFLPVYFLGVLATSYAVLEADLLNRAWLWGCLLAAISGWFWVYPRAIAQAWDASPAHWPYYNLREKMIRYIRENEIPLEQIGTQFPNIGSGELIDLNGAQSGLQEVDLERDRFVFYSNVMNDFSDAELERLEEWEVMKSFHSWTVEVILYKNPAAP